MRVPSTRIAGDPKMVTRLFLNKLLVGIHAFEALPSQPTEFADHIHGDLQGRPMENSLM